MQKVGRVSKSNGNQEPITDGNVVSISMLCYLVFTNVSSESKSAHHLYERFIPVAIFLKKVIPFELLPFSRFLPKRSKFFCTICCQRGNRGKKRGWLGGRIITPRNVGKNSQILRNPLKFAFWPYLGVSKTPYLSSGVMVLNLQIVVRNWLNWVIQCAPVRCLFKRT